jgi:aspartate/methionine/tyrosine aminotransferase
VTIYADRLSTIAPFRVVEMLERARELEREGHQVVHLEVGEPDFSTAEPIVTAGQEALGAGATKYTEALGIPALRAAISGYYASQGLQVEASRIVVTTGASAGLLLLAGLLLNPGDHWLLPDPGYPCNEVFVQLVNGRAQPLPVTFANQYQPTADLVAEHWGASTRGILLASPANPTGALLAAEELVAIADLVRERGGVTLFDEIYQGLTYPAPGDESNYPSGLALVPDLFVVNSFSKYFGMTGWRLGWLVLPPGGAEALTPLAQNLFISPPAVSQHAALAAFEPAAMAIHEQRRQRFEQRRDKLYAGLQTLGFGLGAPPAGAFYVYADLAPLGLEMDGLTFARRLLEEQHVAVTPGVDFGANGTSQHVRFAYTTNSDSIGRGLERIAQALARWA